MKFTVNPFARKCTQNECECKSCYFNGIEGMCFGCNECIEHKLLAPVSSCTIVKKGSWSGFGAIAFNNQYMICVPMGITDTPEYFHITKDEYNSFEDWKDNSAKIIEIQNRENKGSLTHSEMEKRGFSIIENQVFKLKYEGLKITEFEQWVYSTEELQGLLSPEDYLALISLNYKSKHAMNELEKILDKYIDYGKFETDKVITLLKKALDKDEDIGMILRQFYDMYCDGYYFFQDLGLGYGLSCEVPLKYADSWEELSENQKSEILNSFYPQIENDIKRALDWIENKKIILPGTKNDMNRWEFLDYRTPDEKKSTVWFEVEGKNGTSAKKSRLDMKEKKEWWKFWK